MTEGDKPGDQVFVGDVTTHQQDLDPDRAGRRHWGQDGLVPTMVVEVHVPLLPMSDLPDGSYPFPWIEEVENFLSDLEDQGDVEVFDDGEEDGDVYVFSSPEPVRRLFWRWRPAWPRCLGFLRESLQSSVTTRPRSSAWDDG